jgi:hypothetical protein
MWSLSTDPSRTTHQSTHHSPPVQKSQESLAPAASDGADLMDSSMSAGQSQTMNHQTLRYTSPHPCRFVSDFVRLSLEVVHNLLACGLSANPHMVYVSCAPRPQFSAVTLSMEQSR